MAFLDVLAYANDSSGFVPALGLVLELAKLNARDVLRGLARFVRVLQWPPPCAHQAVLQWLGHLHGHEVIELIVFVLQVLEKALLTKARVGPDQPNPLVGA